MLLGSSGRVVTTGTDGHHNRVLRVKRDGQVSDRIAFANIVPTGLAVRAGKVYMAQAGPVPHRPEDGKVVSFGPRSSTATQVASGAPLLVDVEFGRGHMLYALSQGVFGGGPPGSPALPDTGSLVRVDRDGTFTVVADGLDRPTSLEFIADTAYVVTLGGQIWKLDNVTCRRHERWVARAQDRHRCRCGHGGRPDDRPNRSRPTDR
jgi:hypothetical protein